MMLWVALALMTGAAVFAILWPLSRRPGVNPEAGVEARFYREQLAEIERDVSRGLLSPTEAEAAKAEAGRRLLRATSDEPLPADPALGEPALRRRRAASAMALSIVPLIALTVYGAYGSPNNPGQPLSARLKAEPERVDIAAALARIEAHLARHPDDGRGWDVVAPVYLRTGRFEDAAKAFDAANRLLGETAPRLASLGEALMSAKEGIVPAEARAAFERALQLEPGSPKPTFYLAQAAEQDGDAAKARGFYADMIAHAPPDAPWVAVVRERLAALPGGTEAQAVASLGPDDRQSAIRGMVEGLAARLEANGGTADEWSRLVRSYAVLGESGKARAALDKAREALAGDAAQRRALDDATRELQLSAEAGQP